MRYVPWSGCYAASVSVSFISAAVRLIGVGSSSRDRWRSWRQRRAVGAMAKPRRRARPGRGRPRPGWCRCSRGEAVDDLGLTAGLAEGPLDEVAARSRARWMSAASSIDGLPDSVEACVPNSRAKAAPAQSRSADLTLGRQLRVVMAFTALERNRPESAVEAPVAAEGASAIGGSPRPGQLAASSSCWNALLTRSAFWMSVIVASGAARR